MVSLYVHTNTLKRCTRNKYKQVGVLSVPTISTYVGKKSSSNNVRLTQILNDVFATADVWTGDVFNFSLLSFLYALLANYFIPLMPYFSLVPIDSSQPY